MDRPRKLFVTEGQRFGRLTVIDAEARKSGQRRVVVSCDCGTVKTVILYNLLRGQSLSCGCRIREVTAERNRSPGGRARSAALGKRPDNMARLAQMRDSPGLRADASRRMQEWNASPESALARTKASARVKEWNRSPEGIAARAKAAAATRTHGLSKHPLYGTWGRLIARCEQRDITVCDEWRDVTAFIRWAEVNLGPRPAGAILARVDACRGYMPGNVQWAAPERRVRRGRRFGRLVVVTPASVITRNSSGGRVVECTCDCGTSVVVRLECLFGGNTKSCGCLRREGRHRELLLETGQRFGRWVVVDPEARKGKSRAAVVRCSCPEKTIRAVDLSTLMGGQSKSCGCLKRESASERSRNRPGNLSVTVGQRFGRLTVIKTDERTALTPGDPYGRPAALCQCDCGRPEPVLVRVGGLIRGTTKSCGCGRADGLIQWMATPEGRAAQLAQGRKNARTNTRLKVQRGQRFGRLTVVRFAGVRDVRGVRAAACRCVCGSPDLKVVALKQLYAGLVQSCGCLAYEARIERITAPEVLARNAERVTTHGMGRHPQYGIWKAMMSRCLKPTDPFYRFYGAKGITVCQEWQDPRAFLAYVDELPRPSGATWLLRIDRTGSYEPGNLWWAHPTEGRIGNEWTDAPDTAMWCPTCGEQVKDERAFDRHYRESHQRK